jgi:hypothetical protein
MPYYKIVLHLINGRTIAGIRLYLDELVDRVKTKVWHQVKEMIGRHKVDYIGAV